MEIKKKVKIVQKDRNHGRIGTVVAVSGRSSQVEFDDGQRVWYSTKHGIKEES